MSKIIVDQIQANGGDVLTIPSTDAALNNQPIVGSTSGTLSFSPLAMPAADGTANKPLTTDGSGQLQFGAFPLPTTSGSNGNYLSTDGTSTSWAAPPAVVPSLLSAEGLVYGTMVTSTAQSNSYSTGDWSSSGPWTTYRHDQFFSSTTDSTQGFNMLLGDGHPNGTSQSTYVGNSGLEVQRLVQYATGNRVGWVGRDWWYDENSTSYGGLSWRVLPIRNTSASAITINIAAMYTAYTTYNAASLGYFTPTNSSGTAYSTVTGGTWTQLQTAGSGSSSWGTNSISVPANTTILVLLNTAHAYQTTHRFMEHSLFYNLHTTFTDPNIICDLRMLYALHQARTPSATNSSANPEEIYTACATIFGDR